MHVVARGAPWGLFGHRLVYVHWGCIGAGSGPLICCGLRPLVEGGAPSLGRLWAFRSKGLAFLAKGLELSGVSGGARRWRPWTMEGDAYASAEA